MMLEISQGFAIHMGGKGKPFQKGQVANPAGRPPKVRITFEQTGDMRDVARMHTMRALGRLAEIIESDDEKAAVAAAKELLDRGWGKARQEISGPEGGPLQIQAGVIVLPAEVALAGALASPAQPLALSEPPEAVETPQEGSYEVLEGSEE